MLSALENLLKAGAQAVSDHFDDRDDFERDPISGGSRKMSNLSFKQLLPDLGLLVVTMTTYLAVGCVFYGTADLDWSVIDSLYFTLATMSTVGYGDLVPDTNGQRLFTIFMIFVGIIFVFSNVAKWIGLVVESFTARLRVQLDRMIPEETVDIDGDGEADYRVPRHAMVYYTKNLIPSLLLNVMLQMASAFIFVVIEGNGMTYFDALYHCLVTATTVGYGDVAIERQAARLWACFHIILSVALLGERCGRARALLGAEEGRRFGCAEAGHWLGCVEGWR